MTGTRDRTIDHRGVATQSYHAPVLASAMACADIIIVGALHRRCRCLPWQLTM
jgi:hypothetical protein